MLQLHLTSLVCLVISFFDFSLFFILHLYKQSAGTSLFHFFIFFFIFTWTVPKAVYKSSK
jgi:hypothetical protein